MAFSLNYVTSAGLTCDNCYARIEQLNISKTGATAIMRYYVDAGNPTPFESKTYEFNYNLSGNDNAFKQAYEHIKTLPEFSDATDC